MQDVSILTDCKAVVIWPRILSRFAYIRSSSIGSTSDPHTEQGRTMNTDKVLRSFGFEVLRTIGEGCYGQVKLATSERHTNNVAIKVITPSKKDRVWVEKYVPQELAILGKVKHPHIVKVYEIYKMPNEDVFIVMEQAVTDLSEKVKELSCIPVDQAREWFNQLVSAMVYLHQQNIAHRDLKLENILLTADGQVKLTDFGLGCFSELTDTNCGTPLYSAPEVLKFHLYNPKKSDVWSMGVVLYVMVTGELPFNGNSTESLLCEQEEPVTYPSLVTVEESCRSYISYMMEYDPSNRPSMADVAQHPWLQSRQKRVGSRFLVTLVDEDEEEVIPRQEDDSSSRAFRSEKAEEKNSPLCAAVKRAANNVLAPIRRAARSFRRRIKKFFRRNTVVPSSSSAQQDAHHSAGSIEKAPACSIPEQNREDVTADGLPSGPEVEAEPMLPKPIKRRILAKTTIIRHAQPPICT